MCLLCWLSSAQTGSHSGLQWPLSHIGVVETSELLSQLRSRQDMSAGSQGQRGAAAGALYSASESTVIFDCVQHDQ